MVLSSSVCNSLGFWTPCWVAWIFLAVPHLFPRFHSLLRIKTYSPQKICLKVHLTIPELPVADRVSLIRGGKMAWTSSSWWESLFLVRNVSPKMFRGMDVFRGFKSQKIVHGMFRLASFHLISCACRTWSSPIPARSFRVLTSWGWRRDSNKSGRGMRSKKKESKWCRGGEPWCSGTGRSPGGVPCGMRPRFRTRLYPRIPIRDSCTGL